jgi:tRNA(Arg) A34 adenosine deaminase TadA
MKLLTVRTLLGSLKNFDMDVIPEGNHPDWKVKCALLNSDGELISSGVNWKYGDGRPDRHAEHDAVDSLPKGVTPVYAVVTPFPSCKNCAKVLARSGVIGVYVKSGGYESVIGTLKWRDSMLEGLQILKDAGIAVISEVEVASEERVQWVKNKFGGISGE